MLTENAPTRTVLAPTGAILSAPYDGFPGAGRNALRGVEGTRCQTGLAKLSKYHPMKYTYIGGGAMYSKITDIHLNVFDSETNEYMGHSRFKLTQSSERKLLDLLNYNIAPNTLTLLDVALSDTSKNYIAPALFKKNSRISTLYIDAVDAYSGRLVPIEILMSYDVIARGHLSGNPYSFESVELGNIKILNIDYNYPPK